MEENKDNLVEAKRLWVEAQDQLDQALQNRKKAKQICNQILMELEDATKEHKKTQLRVNEALKNRKRAKILLDKIKMELNK